MSDPGKAVFLSYASQDAEAAKRICEALRQAGVEVWFDAEGGLEHGDEWDAKIRRQIKECVLFLPIISANTQAREEGYFRIEWELAAQRALGIASGVAFILPVVIDDTKEPAALVPDRFRSVQWTKLPGGHVPPEVLQRFLKLWSHRTGALKHVSHDPTGAALRRDVLEESRRKAAPTRKPVWPRIALGVAVLVIIAAWFIFKPRRRPEEIAKTVADAQKLAIAPAAAAAAEFPRDPELRRAHRLLYGLDTIAEDFALAEDIVKPLLAARPNEPEVVTVAAEISAEYLTRGFDLTPARRAQAQRLTERAVALAPDSPEALATLGRYLLYLNTQLGRAEELMRRAIELKPAEPRFHRTLFYILTFGKTTTAEGDAFGAQMAAKFPNDPLVAYDIARRYKDRDELGPMEQWFDKTVALAPLGSVLVWKSWIALEIHGDLAGMKTWLDRVPDRQRATPRVANAFYVHAMFSGDTAAAIPLLNTLGDSWMADFDFTGPKALLLGDLLRRNGSDDLARLQYEAALAEVQRVLARDPTDWRPRRAEMLALLALGRRDEARADLRLVLQALPRPYRWSFNSSWMNGALRAAFLLEERELALTMLKEVATVPQTRAILRNLFRLDPRLAAWRSDPEITTILAEPKEQRTEGGGQNTAPLTEAGKLAARAVALYSKLSYTREDLATAEDLARKATELEPDSAAAWGARAGVQATYLYRNWNFSEKRRQDTQAHASRALGLNAEEPEALIALGHLLRQQGMNGQAAAHFRRALAAEPANIRAARALGTTLSFDGQRAEGRAVLLAAVQRDPRDPLVRYDLALTYGVYLSESGQPPAEITTAIEQLDAGLAVQPLAGLLNAKAVAQGGWLGDVPAMRATLAQLEKLPLAERAEDRAVFTAMWGALLDREPARVAAAAALTAKDYFEDTVVPRRAKDWTLAIAHRLEKKDSLARLDWQRAETVLRQRLRDDPNNQMRVVELATTLAWLGRTDEALLAVAPVEAMAREEPTRQRSQVLADFYAAVGDATKAAPYIRQALNQNVFLTSKTLRLDPWFDKLRGQPEFEALLREPAA